MKTLNQLIQEVNHKLNNQMDNQDVAFTIEETIPDSFKIFYPNGIPATGWVLRVEECRTEIILVAYMWPGNPLQQDCIRMPVINYAFLKVNRQRKDSGFVLLEVSLSECSEVYGDLTLLEGVERAFCEQFSLDKEGSLGDKLADVLRFEKFLKEHNLTEADIMFLYHAMCARNDLTTTLAYKTDGTVQIVGNQTENKKYAVEIFLKYAKKVEAFLTERGYAFSRKLKDELYASEIEK